MRRRIVFAFCVSACWLIFSGAQVVHAGCTIPNTLANGNVADASQVMANFNAELACINNQLPAGSTNAVQYNAGSGAFGGVGPLTNGQLIIGSTGNPPQAGTLTAGSGVTIVNGAGSITISATGGGGGSGLYNQILSATPTTAGTGLSTWLNQGSATVTNSAVGVAIDAPADGGGEVHGVYTSAPTAPYTITVLATRTSASTSYAATHFGFYDGSSKLELIGYSQNSGGASFLEVTDWNSATSYNSSPYSSPTAGFAQPIWLQIQDDGTNVYYRWSQDGANFLTMYTVAKSSGWLGASGYSNIYFGAQPQGGEVIATLMSWTQH